MDPREEPDREVQLAASDLDLFLIFDVGGMMAASSCLQGLSSRARAALFPQQLVVPFGTKT